MHRTTGRARHGAALAVIGILVAACSGAASTPGGAVTASASQVEPTPISASAESATGPAPRASASPSSPGPSLAPIEELEAAGATRRSGIGNPDWLVVAGGSTWAAGVGDGVGRLDGKTGKLLGSVAVPGICLAMDVGFGSVWVGSCGTPSIYRIDPETGAMTAWIPLAVMDLREESSLAAGEGGVWALSSGGDEQLVKIDPGTNKVVATFPEPPGSAAIRAAFGALWVTNPGSDSLLRLDPKDGTVIKKIAVGAGPRFLAVGENGVWVLNQADGTVTHVNPKTNAVVATIKVDAGPVDGGDIAVGGGAVWARVTDALVARIDPKTDTVTARYGPRAGSGSVAADADAAWISAHDVNSVWRLPLP